MKCGATGKVIFKKEISALNRAKEILEENGNRKFKVNNFRVYKCEFCGFYHLTTKL